MGGKLRGLWGLSRALVLTLRLLLIISLGLVWSVRRLLLLWLLRKRQRKRRRGAGPGGLLLAVRHGAARQRREGREI